MVHRLLLAGIVAGLSLFTACAQAAPSGPNPAATGGGGSAPPSSAPVTSAPAQGGALGVDEFIGKVTAAQAGVTTYTIDMTMDTVIMEKASKMVMKGAIDQTDKSNVNMKMDMDMLGMKMKMLKIDGDMYLQLDASGDTWMKVPESQMSQYDDTAESADMTASLEKSRDAMKKIELVGQEAVDGTQASHYRITMDAAGLAKLTGSDARISGETFDYDVWLDGSNLLRKVAMEVTAEADGKELPMKVAGIMGHYNEPVDIKAPDSDDVVEMGG